MSIQNTNQQSAFNSDQHSTPIKCSHCDGDAHLIGMQSVGQGYEKRMFECATCRQPTVFTVQT